MEKQGMKEVLTIGRRLSANFAQMDRVSDLPTTIGCTDAIGIGSSGAIDFSRTRPIQRFFEFFLRVLLCMAFLLHLWDLEMFT